MILYLGTSSLAKLYVEEQSSNVLREWAKQAEIVATCRVTYTEMISALEKRFKNNDLSQKDYDMVVKSFSEDWQNFAIVDFDEKESGLFVKKYGLKRFAAMHLSAAKFIRKEHKDISVAFSSLDEELCRAAASEGINVLTYSK